MSKVVKHSRTRRMSEKLGKVIRKKPHNHVTLSKTGYIPTGTNHAVNIEVAKRKRKRN